MKNTTRLKTLMLSLFVAAAMTMTAQSGRTDGFFSGSNDNYQNRDGGITPGVSNQTFDTTTAPLGSGLLIMAAAGAGYAIARRKRNKGTKGVNGVNTIIIAFAMLLGMTQCKKNPATVTPSNDNVVRITVDVHNGSRLGFDPSTGSVGFTQHDKIYVASNEKYIGTLEHNGTTFEGDITSPEVGQPLYFYFLGNITPNETLTAGTTSTLTVNIFDQTNGSSLPVISCGQFDNYNNDTEINVTLYNKCSLVKFNLSTSATGKSTYILGTENQVSFNMSGTTANYSKVNTGAINLGTRTGEVWAIVFPHSADEAVTAYSSDWAYSKAFKLPSVEINHAVAVDLNVNIADGSLPGKFSVTSTKQVQFSKGNLQATTTDLGAHWTWHFAEHQYAFVGNKDANNAITGEGTVSENGTVDVFRWGGNSITNTNGSHINGINFTNTSSLNYNADDNWNETVFPSDYTSKSWHLLTATGQQQAPGEWEYLIQTRDDAANKKGLATITINNEGKHGAVLLPDDWELPSNCSFTAGSSGGWTTNNYSLEQWETMEINGAVFLPAAGHKHATSNVIDVPDFGYYWSCSSPSTPTSSYYVITVYTNNFMKLTSANRATGNLIRLVRDVPSAE